MQVDTSKKSFVFVCTTGRSGTIYLAKLFQKCVREGVKVYHEEAKYGRLLDLSGQEGLVITGRVFVSMFADQLGNLPSSVDVKLIVLVRSLVDTSTSWVQYLAHHPLGHGYFYEKLPGWWGGYRPIKWNKKWTPFQIAMWHWFQTYIRTMEVVEGQQVKYLCFNDLNNLDVMKDVLSWSDCDKPSGDVLAECRSIGTKHGTKGGGSPQSYTGVLREWMGSLSSGEQKLVGRVSQWIESNFAGCNLIPEEC